jgi:hypothetical protein
LTGPISRATVVSSRGRMVDSNRSVPDMRGRYGRLSRKGQSGAPQ